METDVWTKKKRVAAVTFVTLAGLLAACGGGSGGGSNSAGGSKLVFVNYGGSTLEAAKKGWLEPFSKSTGIKIATDSPSDPAKAKAMVDSGRTTWDIMDLGAGSGLSQCGTLYEKRPANFDISAVDPKYVTDDCGVPDFVTNINVVYNKEKYGDNPPTSVADFMNVKKFPGKRIFLNYVEGQVEPLLMVDGVAPKDIYPIDWTRVKDIAGRLGNELTPQDSVVAATQSLESGDYGMCLCYAGSMTTAAKNDAKFGVLWDKTFLAWDSLYAIKGSKNKDAQWKLLQHIATSKGSAPFFKYSPYASPLKEAPETPAEFRDYLPAAHEADIKEEYLYDPKYWSTNLDDANAKWSALLAG